MAKRPRRGKALRRQQKLAALIDQHRKAVRPLPGRGLHRHLQRSAVIAQLAEADHEVAKRVGAYRFAKAEEKRERFRRHVRAMMKKYPAHHDGLTPFLERKPTGQTRREFEALLSSFRGHATQERSRSRT